MANAAASPSALILDAATAQELMTPNPIALRADASIRDAVSLLTDKGVSAAPVIDVAGRPVGVLSNSDIVVHERERVKQQAADQTRVSDLMTPAVFSVTPQAGVERVVAEMVAMRVHRLFVVDADGVLIGVISATDIL